MRVRKLTSWWGALALLVAVRLAIPLAAYAAGNSRLPGIPQFTRPARDGGLMGDATGFYAATREFMAAWGRMPRAVLALDALFALAAATSQGRRPGRRRARRVRARHLRRRALDEADRGRGLR